MKSDTHMRQFRRPEFMESWIGKGLLATVIAGTAISIMLPLPLRDALTYWTVFGIIAGIILLGIIVGSLIQKCWGYAGTLAAALAIILMVFFRVILPNLG